MFFLLSKLLKFLVKPMNWIVGLLLFSAFAKNEAWRQRTFRVGLALLVLLTNHAFFNLVVRGWEPDPPPAFQRQQVYDVAIVLGGYSNPWIEPGHDRYNFSWNANRLTQVLELYFDGRVRKLLLSGGSGNPFNQSWREARAVVPLLVRFGVCREDILVEARSRNTRENAVQSKALLDSLGLAEGSLLLVTSAWHMPRAEGCFRKVGLEVQPWPVDYMSERWRWDPSMWLWPNPMDLHRWTLLWNEWAGYVVYWLRGYIA